MADCADRLAASFVRDRVMQIFARDGVGFEKMIAERYWSEPHPERKGPMYASAIGSRLLQDMNLLPYRKQEKARVSIWKVLQMVLTSQFLPGDSGMVMAQVGSNSGSFDPFRFDPEQSDVRARIGQEAARSLITQYLGADAGGAYVGATPLIQTRYLITALQRLLQAHRWPTAGALYLTDSPASDIANPLVPVRGLFAKNMIRLLLGADSPEYRGWDGEPRDRQRAAMVFKAIESLFARADAVLADPPRMTPEEFKTQIEFKRWVYNRDEDDRTVAEAFGKAGLQRFRELRSQKNGTGALAEPGARELSELYRAAVVRAVVWHWAVYLSL